MQRQSIPLIMAPLAGITDSVFRRIVKRFGADIVYTEMVSAKGLYYGDKKTRLLLRSTEQERPVTVQLFGSDPAVMAEAARQVCAYAPDGIDINMGCPMPKIVRGGDGCALMRDLPLAARVCAAVGCRIVRPGQRQVPQGLGRGPCQRGRVCPRHAGQRRRFACGARPYL